MRVGTAALPLLSHGVSSLTIVWLSYRSGRKYFPWGKEATAVAASNEGSFIEVIDDIKHKSSTS